MEYLERFNEVLLATSNLSRLSAVLCMRLHRRSSHLSVSFKRPSPRGGESLNFPLLSTLHTHCTATTTTIPLRPVSGDAPTGRSLPRYVTIYVESDSPKVRCHHLALFLPCMKVRMWG